jgi:hypothetical protein
MRWPTLSNRVCGSASLRGSLRLVVAGLVPAIHAARTQRRVQNLWLRKGLQEDGYAVFATSLHRPRVRRFVDGRDEPARP